MLSGNSCVSTVKSSLKVINLSTTHRRAFSRFTRQNTCTLKLLHRSWDGCEIHGRYSLKLSTVRGSKSVIRATPLPNTLSVGRPCHIFGLPGNSKYRSLDINNCGKDAVSGRRSASCVMMTQSKRSEKPHVELSTWTCKKYISALFARSPDSSSFPTAAREYPTAEDGRDGAGEVTLNKGSPGAAAAMWVCACI